MSPPAPTVPADVPTTGPNLRYRGEKPPVEPLAALEHSAAGAKAFAEFFIKTIDWGYATTSSTYMRHYFDKSCDQCEIAARFLDNAQRMHEHYVGGRISIRSIGLASVEPQPVLTARVDIASVEAIDPYGRGKSADVAYLDYPERLTLRWANAIWTVSSMQGGKK